MQLEVCLDPDMPATTIAAYEMFLEYFPPAVWLRRTQVSNTDHALRVDPDPLHSPAERVT